MSVSAKKLLLLNPFKNNIIHRDPTIGMKANCVIKKGESVAANYANTIKDKFTIRSDAKLLKTFLTERNDITTVVLSPYDYEVTKVLIKGFPCSAIRDNDDSLFASIIGFKEKLNIIHQRFSMLHSISHNTNLPNDAESTHSCLRHFTKPRPEDMITDITIKVRADLSHIR